MPAYIAASLSELYDQLNARKQRRERLAAVTVCVVIPVVLAVLLHLNW